MKFWLEFFKDKRFSWDFKIANFIMRDSLRNYLAVNCMVLDNLLKNSNLNEFQKRKLNKVSNDLKRLMKA